MHGNDEKFGWKTWREETTLKI